jgi:hypothetical protein
MDSSSSGTIFLTPFVMPFGLGGAAFELSTASDTAGTFPDDTLDGPGLVLSERSGTGGCEVLLALGTALDWLNAGDLVCALEAASDTEAAVGILDRLTGVWFTPAGWAFTAVGDEVTLGSRATCGGNGGWVTEELGAGRASGGGGNGAIPILLLSLAAAAAAAEAYFKVSPGGLVGTAAGFIWLMVPLESVGDGVCNVASVGRGLFICVEGLRAAATGGSTGTFDFPGILLDRVSTSGVSSCTDCVSWEDTRSLSLFMP